MELLDKTLESNRAANLAGEMSAKSHPRIVSRRTRKQACHLDRREP
jgi:hypothetical protein